MRLFAAVVPPQQALAELAAALPPDLPALRLVPEHQRHVTVAFYADAPDDSVAELTERLRRAAGRTSPMSLRFNGFGTFPGNSSRARVLWVGLDGDVAGLSRLAERCTAAGARTGIAMESRRYRPHVTVGRARSEPADLSEVATAPLDGTPWEATQFSLVHSVLGSQAVHTTVATFKLG